MACRPVGDAGEPDTPGVGDAGDMGVLKAAAPAIRGLKAPVLAACCSRELACRGDCPGLWLNGSVAAWGPAASVLDACTRGTKVLEVCSWPRLTCAYRGCSAPSGLAQDGRFTRCSRGLQRA